MTTSIPPPRIQSVLWRSDGEEVEGLSARELADEAGGAGPGTMFWLDVVWPDAAALGALADAFALDANALEDTVAYGERPKVTRHAGGFFVTAYATGIVTAPGDGATDGATDGAAAGVEPGVLLEPDVLEPDVVEPDVADGGRRDAIRVRYRRRRRSVDRAVESRLRASRVSMFVLPGGLITVRRDDSFDIAAVVARWRRTTTEAREGAHGLLHAVLDAIVDGQLDTAEQFDDALEDIEDRLFDERLHDREVQKTNYRLRKELVHFRRVVLPMRDVVSLIIRHGGDHEALSWSRELQSDFADLYDHVLRVAEWSESLRELVTTIFETNLSLQDARLNTVMKKLTGWAAIIAVPTAITGWFGQNVPYPGSDEVSGLIGSTVAIIVLAAGLFVLFRRKDWI